MAVFEASGSDREGRDKIRIVRKENRVEAYGEKTPQIPTPLEPTSFYMNEMVGLAVTTQDEFQLASDQSFLIESKMQVQMSAVKINLENLSR